MLYVYVYVMADLFGWLVVLDVCVLIAFFLRLGVICYSLLTFLFFAGFPLLGVCCVHLFVYLLVWLFVVVCL